MHTARSHDLRRAASIAQTRQSISASSRRRGCRGGTARITRSNGIVLSLIAAAASASQASANAAISAADRRRTHELRANGMAAG